MEAATSPQPGSGRKRGDVVVRCSGVSKWYGERQILYDVELETSSDDGRAGCSQGDANLIVASAFECFANAADDAQRRTLTVRCASSDGAETLTLCAGGDLELPVDRVLSLEGKVSRRGGTLRRDPGRLAVSFPRLSEVAS